MNALLAKKNASAATKSPASSSNSNSSSTVYPAPLFDKLMVANRGEIAVRVFRTAKKMGIKTVAVYSDADVDALHVKMADEAVRIGPAPSNQSYLQIPNLLKAIEQTGTEAVHPGYGFLSERSEFVEALDKAGVSFLGPPAQAMASMGDKIQSKIIAKAAGVNTIPGFNGVVRDVDHALEIAAEIGYPVMIKASAGGGGKGMRIAWNEKEVAESFKLASAESLSSFGDNRLLVEKFIDEPRHIEIQLIGDKHGNVLYLPERECSIQRRNQKVIEEAPSTHIDPETRRAMGEQAVALAKGVNYFSAGTVEFLVDSNRNFYFLELNSRLQVEHAITEMVTGMDLVEEMIRVAAGEKLRRTQKDVGINGWSFESRVYAEDPEKYLPSIGTLSRYIEPRTPTSGEGIVRCDSGIVEGSEISIYYDPMICKLITHAPTRNEAIDVMNKALDKYVIKGVTHNIPLLREVYSHPRFIDGKISTKFLAEEYPHGFRGHKLNHESLRELAATAGVVQALRVARERSVQAGKNLDDSLTTYIDVVPSLAAADGVRLGTASSNTFHVTLTYPETGAQDILDVSTSWAVDAPLVDVDLTILPGTSGAASGKAVETRSLTLQYLDTLPLGFRLQHYGTKFDLTVLSEDQFRYAKFMKEKPKPDLFKVILAPMPGNIVSVAVKVGDEIAEGAELAVVEAMKMQNVLRASRTGKIKAVNVKAGDNVAADEILIEFE
ncbi:hypothetical protein GQ42DRAFT_167180 [Ramicandelaber brevisporus]|nr:hypothetical protein GQ42DRAFT_167180 [Ramicandelaber brevisporus]